MEGKKLLKEFYVIADELEKNIIKFNKLEEQLKIAREEQDKKMAKELLNEYKIVSQKIKNLKERSEILKAEN